MQSKTDERSILIVDDNLASLDFLTVVLTGHGYQVRVASSGQAALEALRETLPDIVLLDLMMPKMDGYEVCQQLKAHESTRDIPVLFISAHDETMDKVKAFEVGGVDYITKPFGVQEVLARVRTHLVLRDMQKRLQEQNIQLKQEITERKQTEVSLQHRNRELSLLNQVGQMFGSSLELEQVLATILGEIQSLLDVFSISLWLIVPENDELVCMQAKGPGSDDVTNWRLPLGQGITGQVAQHGESRLVIDTWADEQHFRAVDKQSGVAIRSMLSIPLRAKGTVIAVLNLVDTRVGHFTQNDLILLEPIATAAAIAIENARLYTTAQQEIAERKRAEAALLSAHNELKEKNVQLQELNASKDKFFSIISHDLRSPFNTLLGFAQLLTENVERYNKDQIKSYVDKLYTSAERLYALLENLLTWSRLQRGVMEYEPEDINILEIAEDNIGLFLSKADQKQIDLTSSIPQKILTYADYNMVNTVVRNLISNALKFTKAGDTVDISVREYSAHIEVAVSDSGIGISQEDRHKLFRIDVQHSNVGTAGEAGTGLGLVLCQELVERNSGRIWVESEVGKGATFRFTLPRVSI